MCHLSYSVNVYLFSFEEATFCTLMYFPCDRICNRKSLNLERLEYNTKSSWEIHYKFQCLYAFAISKNMHFIIQIYFDFHNPNRFWYFKAFWGCIIRYFGKAVNFHKSLGKVRKIRLFLFCNTRRRWSLSYDARRCSKCRLTLNYRDTLSKFINVLSSASY